jgi:hypothetical protein
MLPYAWMIEGGWRAANGREPPESSELPPPGESEINRTSRRRRGKPPTWTKPARRLLAEDARYFLHQSVSTPAFRPFAAPKACWIEDTAGRRYLDFHGNNAHHLGYGHPRLIAAIKQQLDRDLPSFAPRRFTCEPAVELARRLTPISPPGLDKVLFATGGSDAVEIALKIARAATGRFKTLSFWDAFHGAGFGAASVGGEALFRSGPIGPLLAGYRASRHPSPAIAAPTAIPATMPVSRTGSQCRLTCANWCATCWRREGDIAAVIAEPARAACPTIPPPGFWRIVREACDEHGALLIFDEIPTGLGQNRPVVRLRTRSRSLPTFWCWARRWAAACCRWRRPLCRAGTGCGTGLGVRPLHPREKPGHWPRSLDHAGDHRRRRAGGERPRQGERALAAVAGDAGAPSLDRRRARARSAARGGTGHGPRTTRRPRTMPPKRCCIAPGARTELQNQLGQCADPDPAADHHLPPRWMRRWIFWKPALQKPNGSRLIMSAAFHTDRSPADLVIIGGGLWGLSIAWHYARLDRGRVILLERNTLASPRPVALPPC